MAQETFTFKELAGLIDGLPKKYSQKIIAIDGASGAGKNTFAEELHKVLPNSHVIHADDFLKIKSARVDGNGFTVSPNFDWHRFESEIVTPLEYNEEVVYHVYDFKKDTVGEKISVPKDATIILEGEYVTQNKFSQFYDFKIWVEAPESVRMTRILEKDGEHFWKEWQEKRMPIEENYLEKEKQNLRTDLVVNGNAVDFKTGSYQITKS